MARFPTASSPSHILISIHRYTRAHRCVYICRSHLSRSHMCTPSTKAHFVKRIAPCLQVHMYTPRSHVYAAFTDARKHFTGKTSRLQLQTPFRRFYPCSSFLHTIFTNANPVHKFTSNSYTHTPFNCSNVHIPLSDERHRVYYFWMCPKRSKSFLRNLVRSELFNSWRPIFSWRFWPCSVNDI